MSEVNHVIPRPLHQTPHRVAYINQQGEQFNSLADLEEYELEKKIFTNLHTFVNEHLRTRFTKDFFQFLVKHRTEVATLLTCGNLESTKQGRTLK